MPDTFPHGLSLIYGSPTLQYCYRRPMKRWIFFSLCSLVSSLMAAQQAFPVKVNNKWGLIDAAGRVILAPAYDAIGEFKHFGYAAMQRSGKVGLLDEQGREVVRPVYEDLKMIDSSRVAVMDAGQWLIVDLQGRIVLDKGYERVKVLDGGYLAFMKGKKWGIVDELGRLISAPAFDEIRQEPQGWFLTLKSEKYGLLDAGGKEIIPNTAEAIQFFNDSLFLVQVNGHWGAVDASGKVVVPPRFDGYQKVSEQFIKWVSASKAYLYSLPCGSLLTAGDYDNFFPFSRRFALARKGKQLGLLDWCGTQALEAAYDEIQPLSNTAFRVQRQGKWGIHAIHGKELAPLRYDYISPPKGAVCVVKLNGRFGLLNAAGEEIAAPEFLRIELEENTAKAYRKSEKGGELLTLLEWDEQGRLSDNNNFNRHFRIRIAGIEQSGAKRGLAENNYLLDDFEWFYAPAKDRWGLRKLSDGSIQIEPKFNSIQIIPELGFTLVGMNQNVRGDYERTTFRFEAVFGLVSNSLGRLVTEPVFLDIRFEDFRQGHPLARCVFSNGRHGLIDRIGRIVKRDLAYIGDFNEGMARYAAYGSLSGSMKPEGNLGRLKDYFASLKAPVFMVDYTEYDQVFQKEAWLICHDCQWGYIDTAGQVTVPAQYAYAKDFVNGVGIVECDGKWGMVNRKAEVILPCRYDGVQFLENTGNRIVRIYIHQPKYGLIDTLGRLTVSAIYDEIGSFREGRLAVKRNGLWGYADRDGLEVIPCRFRDAQAFSEGRAAVKPGRFWGYIDKLGDTGIEFKLARAGSFHEGLAWAQSGNNYGFIDSSGHFVIPEKFDRAFDFQNGIARVISGGKIGLIDAQGRYALRPKYQDMQPFDAHGLALVRYGKSRARYGIVNRSGVLITKRPYREIRPFRDGLAAVRLRDHFGFIDTTGKMPIAGPFSKVSDFAGARAAVQREGKCGYIDPAGNFVVPMEYSRCSDYEQGKAIAYKGLRQAYLLDMDGNATLEQGFGDRLLRFSDGRGLMRTDDYTFYYITEQSDIHSDYYRNAGPFRHGVAVVETNGKWGVIDQRGIAIIPPKYDRIESFENGYAKVRILGFSGLTNLNGELIVQPDYEYISYAGEGLFRVEQGDKIGYFDQEGKWVWDLAQ